MQMTYTVESKNMLAKLMATENINIVHQKIQTAMFDPKNRTLYLPIWQNMTDDLRDLLLGHEVGHALETPAEGWHKTASSNNKKYKAFLNVVEDARIEKKIKRRYPGLKRSFVKGYQELINRDFFGIKDTDVNSLFFIDRLNLYTKGGVFLGIKFNAEETSLLNEVEQCETWEDVVRVTEKVYEYSKEEQFEQLQTVQNMAMAETSDDVAEENDDSNNESQGSDGEMNYDSDLEADETDSKESSDSEESSGENGIPNDSEKESEKLDEEKADTDINRLKATKNHSGIPSDFEPTCDTDDFFRQKENELIDNKSYDYTYCNLPQPILKNILVPYKKVQEHLTNYYKSQYSHHIDENQITKATDDFKFKNERYVSLLAKEFEMRKAASKFAKAKISNTGDIDVNNIYKYKIDENIFKKIMRVPKGKSHGLILLLDYSGSMQYNMASSIEQLLVIAMFCRKVSIPFHVYSFGNSDYSRAADFKEYNVLYGKLNSFSRNPNEMEFSDLSLREYMNSSMSNLEFKNAIRNMIALKLSYENTRIGRPLCETLSNTPLNEAMVALKDITIDFRKKNHLDIVNLVVIHDGDADYCDGYVDSNGHRRGLYSNVVITDTKTKYQMHVPYEGYSNTHAETLRSEIFEWYSQMTGAKIFGFFLMNSKSEARRAIPWRYYDENGLNILGKKQYTRNEAQNIRSSSLVKEKADQMFKDKFLVSYSKGYSAFYLVPGGSDLRIDDGEFSFDGKVTVSKLKTAFVKHNKKRQLNRILASKFIEGIAL